MRSDIEKSQPVETGLKFLSFSLSGPLKNMVLSPPAQKAHAQEIYEKLAAYLKIAVARTGRYLEEALHKAGVGANRPRV
jgi:hypothetical protein